MKSVSLYADYLKRATILLPLLLVLCWSGDAEAQYVKRWLDIGSYHHDYSEAGATSEDQDGSEWPAILGWKNTLHHSDAVWVAVTDWEDEEGRTWPHKIAHKGPRVMGIGEVFPIGGMQMTTRYEDPKVYVDGLLTFDKAASPDEVTPDMMADRKLEHKVNFLNGITMEREIRAFSQQYHDNYHIIEYTFTNTGNIDDDPEKEFKDRTLTGVYFYFSKRWGINQMASGVLGNGAKWGRENMFDAVGDGHEDYEVDFSAQFGWSGHYPSFTKWDPVGAPAIEDNGWYTATGDSVGRITAPQFAGRAVIRADGSPGDTANASPEEQPSTMVWYSSDDDVLDYGQTAFDEKQQAAEYDLIASGRKYPHHADFINPDEDLAHPPYGPNPMLDTPGGHKQGMGFGPYTLEPGDDIHIVLVAGADGLSLNASSVIGRKYKEHWKAGNDFGDIEYDANGNGQIESDEVMDKNEWIMTGRDSLLQTYKRAIANYRSGYDIPRGPKPPREFRVKGGIDAIELSWETYDGENPTGFEIYRTQNMYQGAIKDDRTYQLIAELGPDANSYSDTGITRGIDYYYYIQAVGEENTDPTGLTPTGVKLKSNRYLAQTYDPASLKRAPGQGLSDVRVVPNPYHLSSDKNVRWPDIQDKIGFLNVPGSSTIKIFTERGDLVETIEHTDGSGDEFWDLTTRANQLVVSGLYIAVITDNDSGKQIQRKFVIVR